LLAGDTFAGKTSLFVCLKEGEIYDTFMSMVPNEDTFRIFNEELNASPITIIDYPGSERVRAEFGATIARCHGIVFVIDSSGNESHLRDSSKMLYSILTDNNYNKREIPMLIACNKSDKVTARKPFEIVDILLNELEELRRTQTSAPSQLEEDEAEQVYLGIEGEKLALSHLPPINFKSCSVADGEISEVIQFIRSVVP